MGSDDAMVAPAAAGVASAITPGSPEALLRDDIFMALGGGPFKGSQIEGLDLSPEAQAAMEKTHSEGQAEIAITARSITIAIEKYVVEKIEEMQDAGADGTTG